MYGHVSTVVMVGMDARVVDVEARLRSGRFAFSIVGLPDKAVAESRERVCSALHAAGLALPAKRITVNLAPADLPKEGSHYDLPIALALLSATGAIDQTTNLVALGELGLDGSVRGVPGVLPAAIGCHALGKALICASDNRAEAAWASESLPIIAAQSLLAIVNHLAGVRTLARPKPNTEPQSVGSSDLLDVRGQASAKRALEIAAAGGHNLLMIGPPGCGKSMLAARLPSLLPGLSPEEMLEVSMIHSMAGGLLAGRIRTERPFRAPHHSASMAALIGGGVRPKPGEISMAHHGVLFLDELPEFNPPTLDALRQPLETGEAVIARVNHRMVYPARFQLIAAMNPCRCAGSCAQGARCSTAYRNRLSGPLLDRIDLTLELPVVKAADLDQATTGETSAEVRKRVSECRIRQAHRFELESAPDVLVNARATGAMLERTAPLAEGARALLRAASDSLGLSARGYHRVLRVARTIADLDEHSVIAREHIAEAISYREVGRQHAPAFT